MRVSAFIIALIFCISSLTAVFTDVTETVLGSLPAQVQGTGSIAFPDINNDGWADLFISPYHFYINNQNGTFTHRDATDLINGGIPNTMNRPAFSDADNDGDLDCVVSVYYGNQAYYLENLGAPDYLFNVHGIYTHPTNVLGGQPTFIDGDADGTPEIYLGMFGNWSPNYAIGWDQYLKRNTTGGWDNVTSVHFPQLTDPLYRRPSRGTVAADYDRDGDMDMFIPVYGISYSENWEDMLWDNNGSEVFTDVAEVMNVNIEPHGRYQIGLGSGASWGDYDNDGDFDIALSNIHGWAAIYTNNYPEPFTNDTEECGLITSGAEKQWHNTLWTDLDNDGDLDLLLTQFYDNYTSYIFRNDGPESIGHFTDVTTQWGFNQAGNLNFVEGFCAGDYDNDGDMDLAFYSNQPGYAGTWFYQNDLDNSNHWLGFNLQGNGTTTNTTATGTTLQIYYQDGKKSPLMQVESSSGDMVMNMLPIHVGLGDYETFQEIRVDWLGGETEYFSHTEINDALDQYIEIVQGSGHPQSSCLFVDVNNTGNADGSEQSPFVSLQEAINQAQDGYLITVKPGYYFENLDLDGKGVTITCSEGAEQCTIIGLGSDSVIITENSPTQTATINGLWIIQGNAVNGGGIRVSNTNLNLENVYLTNNTASQRGGALTADNASISMKNCRIESNSANLGGAVSLTNNSSLTVDCCSIRANTTQYPNSQAAVMYLDDNCNVQMLNCLITNNQTSGNDAECGGLFIENGTAVLINCTIADNNSTGGSAVMAVNSGLTIENSIVWHNQPNNFSNQDSQVSLAYSNIDANVTGAGLLRIEPRFVSRTEADYHITNFSACAGAGTNTPSVPIYTDIDGNERPNPNGTNMDIGCYEIDAYFPYPIQLFVSTTGSDTANDGSISSPFATIQHAIDTAIGGDTIIVANGTYYECLNYDGKNTCIRSQYATSHNPEDIGNTIIDAGSAGHCVEFSQGETAECSLDGFTLINGNSNWGGGVYITGASPTLKNLIIRNNQATDRGGAVYCQDGNPALLDSYIYANTCGNRGGAMFIINSDLMIERCLVYGNESGNQGGAFALFSGETRIINCTVTDNAAGESSTGGALFGYSTNPIIVNSIFWNNGETPYSFSSSLPVFAYCNIEGGIEGSNILDTDPGFVDQSTNNYLLNENSECIDAGVVEYSLGEELIFHINRNQYWGNAPDMGYWEYGLLPNEPDALPSPELLLGQNYPNPFNPTTTIQFSLAQNQYIELVIYNVKGQKVTTLAKGVYPGGKNLLVWDGRDGKGNPVSSGIYFYSLQSNIFTKTHKMVLLK
ncbi:MAG: VCBS repeat-containing protein [Candidatus Cloacimonetes bacterium]|nr:VCBS repeat-containing protein [Candidatus Cloacimonadota bacterium]